MRRMIGVLLIVVGIIGGYCLYLTNENRKLILNEHKAKIEEIKASAKVEGVVIDNPLVSVAENNQQEGGQIIATSTNKNKKVVMRTVASTKQRAQELRRQIATAMK